MCNGEDLKIVGIVQPKDAQTATMLSTGIYYPSSLVQHIIEKSSTTQIVQDQLKNKNMNIFTGKAFEEKNSIGGFTISLAPSVEVRKSVRKISADSKKTRSNRKLLED